MKKWKNWKKNKKKLTKSKSEESESEESDYEESDYEESEEIKKFNEELMKMILKLNMILMVLR